MATAARVNEAEAQRQITSEFSTSLHGNICVRCGGLMVREFCTDLLNSTGELDFATARCVQCGDVIDPVIRRNRHLQQMAGTVNHGPVSI
jgi:hypothetical protein